MVVPPQLSEKLGATYTFHRELGGGGMARVFLAEDTRLRRRVVVKILSPDLASSVSAERFEREIRTAAILQQANIVPLFDAGDADGTMYFTMPYVEGESLRARLDRTGALAVGEVVSVLRDVARALAYAHDRAVVHRDIKPDNILISDATAVVADFGIAKAIVASRREGLSESTLTQLGTSIGTPAYMSPEQAAGDPHVDDRADLYALGCTAYEMLTGAPPFVGRSVHQLVSAHLEVEPRDVRLLRPKMPAALADLVMQCLEKNPADRPSARDLLRRLEEIPAGTSQTAAGAASGAAAAPPLTARAFGMYAIAFVLVAGLARLAVSRTGLPDWVFTGALVVMALGLPVLVLTALRASPHLNWKRAALGGGVALASFVVIVAGYMALRSLGIGPAGSLLAAGRMQPKQPILVADFRSLGADSTLGAVVAEAVRADLNQSKVVRVVPASRVAAALERMQKPAGSGLDNALAREVARREGIGAIVDGEIRPLGTGFLVSIRLTQTDSAHTLATFQATADSPSQLIQTLGTLSRKLRGKIGESLKDVRESPPLERVTTASLAALEKYTAATRAFNEQDWARFRRNMEEAIALDSGFAMAYRRLAIETSNRGGEGRRTEFLMKKAVDNAERLPPSERHLATASYWLLPAHPDWDKALDALHRALEVDSNNAVVLNNIGYVHGNLRDFERALQWYQRAKQADPENSTPYLNLTSTTYIVGGFPALEAHVAEMRLRFPTRPLTAGMTAIAVHAAGYPDSAAALFSKRFDPRARGGPSEPVAFSVAFIRATQGRLTDALHWFGNWVHVRANRGAQGGDVQLGLIRAWFEGWYLERRDRAVQIVDSLIAGSFQSLDVADRPYDWAATVYAMAGKPDRARSLLAEAVRVDGWSDNRPMLPVNDARRRARHSTLGWIALAENRARDAVTEFRKGDVGDCLTCVLPLVAMAQDAAGSADSAIVTYERYLGTRDLYRYGDEDFLAATYKRLGELYEARGDKQQAAGYYLKFVELWKNADAPLQPMVSEVRRRLSRLKDTEGAR